MLKAEPRTIGSKGKLNRMRIAGQLPSVLHTHGGESVHLAVSAHDLKKVMNTPAGMNVVLTLDIEGAEPQLAMIEQIERNPLKAGVYTHVCFTKITMGEKIEIRVPVVLVGQDKKSSNDGLVSLLMHDLLVKSAPDAIPEQFIIDVTTMKAGDAVHVKDIELPEGCEAVMDPEELVLHVMAPRAAESTTEGTAAVETPETEED